MYSTYISIIQGYKCNSFQSLGYNYLQVNFAIQCDICQNRKPVRFGKRSSSPEINVNVRGAAVLPSPHLLSLLLQRAAAESQSLAQDDGNDSTVQFQLNYQ